MADTLAIRARLDHRDPEAGRAGGVDMGEGEGRSISDRRANGRGGRTTDEANKDVQVSLVSGPRWNASAPQDSSGKSGSRRGVRSC